MRPLDRLAFDDPLAFERGEHAADRVAYVGHRQRLHDLGERDGWLSAPASRVSWAMVPGRDRFDSFRNACCVA